MKAKLKKPYPVGYIQIPQGTEVIVMEEGYYNTRVLYMNWAFTVFNEDIEIIH